MKRRDDPKNDKRRKPEYLTVKETALYLRVSPKTVMRRIQEGSIISTRPSWHHKISDIEIERFLTAREAKRA